MSLKYTLTENHLTSKKEDYTARTVDVKSNDINTIIEYMLQKGSTITKADILAVLNDFFEAIAHFTANGESINTDLIKTTLSISGVFDDVTDPFDKKKHHIKVNTNAGKVLKKALESIKVERVSVPDNNPHILEVKDSISSSVNDKITSGGVVEIIGGLLKIEGTDTNNGVHFIASDGTKHKVVTFVENKPSKLIVIVPALTAGTYTLEVSTQFNGTSVSKQIRNGTFAKTLTVS